MLLRRAEGGSFSQEVVVILQFEDFFAQAFEFLAFGLVHRFGRLTVRASAGSFFLHLGDQRLLAEVQFLGYRADVASGIYDQAGGFSGIVLGEGPALLFVALISDILPNAGSGGSACSDVHQFRLTPDAYSPNNLDELPDC